MRIRNILIPFFLVSFLSACSTTPDLVIDEAQATLPEAGVDRRSGSGLFEHPSRRSDVEVLGLDGEGGFQGEGIVEMTPLGGLLDDELIGEFKPIIYFGYDQFVIDEASMETLKFYSQQMLDNPRLLVTLEGHTDERGSPSYNLALGERRAVAATEAMMLLGVARERITVVSFGEEQPAAFGHDEASWAQNRRVELRFN
ncbi:OmpA family protein [Thiomicrospira microaerophila]|uniref:OmpA family protein n=1 Tax=Thiomicrospira microaerophila TaxID=406020 RepID=UPI0005C83423|nr:OmpA family protein [Thiomicrospira microaerophila]